MNKILSTLDVMSYNLSESSCRSPISMPDPDMQQGEWLKDW